MIKLGNTGGIVVSSRLHDIEEIIKITEEQAKNEQSYELKYKEMLSRNMITSMKYKYLQQFKQINYKIYQV